MCYTCREMATSATPAQTGKVAAPVTASSPPPRRDEPLTAPPSPLGERAASVTRRVLHVTHSLNYEYPRPPRNLVTRLCLVPPPVHGPQIRHSYDFYFAPLPHATPEGVDQWGNHYCEARHEKVERNLTIAVSLKVETACAYTGDGAALPIAVPLSAGTSGGADDFLASTRLTEPDDAIRTFAREADEYARKHSGDGADPFSYAFRLCRLTYMTMRYKSGATGVSTTALEAFAMRQGVCQDFAHILLAVCRINQMPARYVSGFLPGEGAMHAWVEVLLPVPNNEDARAWYALDPTHDRWVTERYVTVATGRDYYDITPTSGTYYGRGPGVLSHHSRVVIENTEIVSPEERRKEDRRHHADT